MLLNLIKKFGITKRIFLSFSISLAVFLYFFYYAFFGNKGVVKYFHLSRELQEKNITKNHLQNKVKNKENLVNGMNTKSLNIDLLDEQARKNLGYANKNEIVIYDEEKDETDQ